MLKAQDEHRKPEKPRPYRAGWQMGEALGETANILYLLDNREQFLSGIHDRIEHELHIVKRIRQEMPQ